MKVPVKFLVKVAVSGRRFRSGNVLLQSHRSWLGAAKATSSIVMSLQKVSVCPLRGAVLSLPFDFGQVPMRSGSGRTRSVRSMMENWSGLRENRGLMRLKPPQNRRLHLLPRMNLEDISQAFPLTSKLKPGPVKLPGPFFGT